MYQSRSSPFKHSRQSPTCSILIDDFNAKCSQWCNSDKDDKTGSQLDNITTSAGYIQVIDKPTYFINESSYIDLIFSSNARLPPNGGICIWNIHLPTPYYREVWDTNEQILKLFQKLLQYLIGRRLSGAKQYIKNVICCCHFIIFL